MDAEHSTGPYLFEVGEVDARKSVEQVGLGGSDARSGLLGARTKRAADGHAVIVRSARSARGRFRWCWHAPFTGMSAPPSAVIFSGLTDSSCDFGADG
ncbi:hypothetical protein SPAR_30306 [Streptomyces sparsogenes DSM 40356]|uniref:Uncharacterized protein n=1 Tax=Streptomyces sparsogenes DSM 40356 TaxID=1331668 RepID=A0A1R1SBG1_9ACTN|nr:hypothetical protein SPAR_30306 [Streptomyces sparsogenes DSM 40356]